MSALIASQVICMFLLLIGTFAAGVLPVLVQKFLLRCDCVGPTCKTTCTARRGKLVTTFLIYLGGGVLLGTCLLHLLPESREGFESHDHHDDQLKNESVFFHESEEGGHSHESFPLPEFVVCCGFFAVYLFEVIVHHFLGGHTHVPTETKAIRSLSRSNSCNSPPPVITDLSLSGKVDPPPPQQCPADQSAPVKFSVAGLLTVAALSFHSLFEGFAVGLRDDALSTWIVYAAVAVHKYVIAFVVGLEVLAGGGKKIQLYVYMAIFAFMSPLGMAIAMITQTEAEESSPLTVSVLNAIATGTLLYVTFFEILQRDESKDIPTWMQLVATFTGFVIICLVQFGSTFA